MLKIAEKLGFLMRRKVEVRQKNRSRECPGHKNTVFYTNFPRRVF